MIIDKQAYDINGNIVTSLAQWDSDVNIYLSDPQITKSYTVHFCSASDDEYAIPMEGVYSGNRLRVQVPNAFLRVPYPITVYVYIDIDGGYRSVFRSRINVVKKQMPSDYVYAGTDDYVSVNALFRELREAIANVELYNRDCELEADDDGEGNVTLQCKDGEPGSGGVPDPIPQINVVNFAERGNMNPITSNAVYVLCGNIEALMGSI